METAVSTPEHPEVVRELNELRKGRGLDAPELVVGPLLRTACSITEHDRLDEVRSKLRLRLGGLCSRLPDDLRLAAEVALGLHPEAQGSSSRSASSGSRPASAATRERRTGELPRRSCCSASTWTS
jgi:hypothetical protein